ncbi:MAG: 4-hydroxythreonine-4-phosphate dehydrogenase PdxA [Betaproteobacteria bacterium]|nr:4-hydroxythreonine-4-phosphate dehydrogenase PdxA [Betaproteobacteria bacterium]
MPDFSTTPTLAVTAGEPAGIGPDLCALLAQESFAARLVILGDSHLIAERAKAYGVDISGLTIEHLPLPASGEAGTLNPANSAYVIALLDRAIAGCLSGEFDGMVTAPIHKGAINDAALPGLGYFFGHTEYLAQQTHTERVVMMLAGGTPPLRVALATTHLALQAVPAAITAEGLTATLRILARELQQKFAIRAPRILVAGLNPHAGESGHMGREEIDIIIPVIEALKREGMQLTGPLPADTLFTPQHLREADAVLAMYHDQGLPVLKYATFGQGVNITLGLPFIRTSVDHGTALDLARDPQKYNKIECGSMREAINLAASLAASCAAKRRLS